MRRALAGVVLSIGTFGCATLRTTGDLRDYPVQVYSGTQFIVADEAAYTRSHPKAILQGEGISMPWH